MRMQKMEAQFKEMKSMHSALQVQLGSVVQQRLIDKQQQKTRELEAEQARGRLRERVRELQRERQAGAGAGAGAAVQQVHSPYG